MMISCPVCLSTHKTHLFKVPGATVSKCTKCSHSFSHDLQASPQEVYNEGYFKEHHANWFKHPNFPLFERISKTIEKEFGRKDVSVLDVGCGNGDFLHHLHKNGFTNLTGIDFSKNEHESIKFLQANIFEINEDDFQQKFDVIVTLATIEHVENLYQFMSILNSLAKPGGIICIMTLDENSLLYHLARQVKKAGISHGVNRLYDKHHLNHFSRESLRNLVQGCGKYQILEHYGINFPVLAIDLPKSILNIFIRPMIMLLFFMTSMMKKKEFLQVVTLKFLSSQTP